MSSNAPAPPLDILLAGGRVIDPAQGLDASVEIGIRGERVAAVGQRLPRGRKTRVVDCRGLLVVPGLIDLHVHVAPDAGGFGLDPDAVMLQSGATTLLDAGSAGSGTWPRFRDGVISRARARVLALINLGRTGLLPANAGELLDPAMADAGGVARIVREEPAVVRGVKLRAGAHLMGEGDQGWRHLRLAVATAREAGTFLMVHIGSTPMSLGEIASELSPGDVITHCYKGGPYHHRVLDESGRVDPRLLDAAAAGVAFDVGHGSGSFDWDVAQRAVEQGLVPTTISTDLHTQSVKGPVFDLPTTLAKFLSLGLSLPEVVARCTAAPARLLGLDDQIGSLRPGSAADVTLLRWREGKTTLLDSYGKGREAEGILQAVGVIRAGRVLKHEGG